MPPMRAARSARSPRTPVSPATWRCLRGCRGSWPPKPASCSRSCRRPAAPPAVTRSTTSRTSGARCGISSPPKPKRPRAHEPRAPMSEGWQSYVRRIEELAARSGLEFHRVDFEAVPDSFMMEIAVYGLPVRMPHWSFGVRYIYQLIQRHMGHSRRFAALEPLAGGSAIEVKKRAPLPPHPERDLLWFVANYAPEMESWERDIFLAVREESFYFYPVFATQIMNEGWASYWHARLLREADFI